MITKIIDGGKFDDIKAIRVYKKSEGYNINASEEIPIKDLTKEELIDITRTYYLALQEIETKVKLALAKLEKKIEK